MDTTETAFDADERASSGDKSEVSNEQPSLRRFRRLLAAALLIGVALRLLPIASHLPQIRHPDEPTNLGIVSSMADRTSLIPDRFPYPSSFFYLELAVHVPAALVARATGHITSVGEYARLDRQAMGTTSADHPSAVLIGRLLNVLLGGALIGAIVWLAWLTTRDRRVVLLAAWLAALCPLMVVDASRITPDTLSGLLATLAAATALRTVHRPGLWTYAAAGAMVGFAFTAKYNTVAAGVPLAALWVSDKDRQPRQAGVAAAAAVGASLLVMPSLYLATSQVVGGIQGEMAHYRGGHDGFEGAAWKWNLWWVLRNLGPIALLAPAAPFLRRNRTTMALGLYLVAAFLVVSVPKVRFERNLLPLLPTAVVLACAASVTLWDRARTTATDRSRVLAVIGITGLLIWPLVLTVTAEHDLLSDHDHAAAARYIEQQLGSSGNVALDNYSPVLRLSPRRVQSSGFVLLGNPSTADVVVVTRAGSGRFLDLDTPSGIGARERLDSLRRHACERRSFDDGGIEVLVLGCG
jgi:4-amino-4-deoxy-L-arabinose transferase-like glycosyltransferase